MIRIDSLKIENFMNITEAYFEFSSINYFYGEPASGKSAVFEAISICFSSEKRSATYGEYVKQGCDFAKIDLKFKIYDDDAEIVLVINRVAGTPYECTLTYKGETYKNTKATEKLNKTFNLEYLSKIMFQMQNAQDIVDHTPSSRLEYIKNLFNFDYSDQKMILTQRMQELKNKNQLILSQKSSNTALKEELSKLEKEVALPYSENDIAHFNSVINENIEEISKANKLMEEEKAHLQRLHQFEMEISNLKSTLNVLNTKKSNIETYKNQIATSKTVVSEIEVQNEKLKEEEENLLNSISVKKTEIDNAADVIKETIKDKNILIGKLDSLKERHESCKNGVCPICGQKTNDVVSHFENDIEKLEKNIGKLSEEETLYYEEKRTRNQALEDLNSKLTDIRDKINSNLFSLKSCEKTIRDLESLVSDEKNINDTIVDTETKLEIAQKNYKYENSVEVQKMNIDGIIAENNDLSSKIKEYELCVNKNKDIQKRNENKLKKVEELENSLNQIEKDIIENSSMNIVYDEAWDILNKLLPQYRTKIFCDTIKNDLNIFIHTIFPKYDVLVEPSKKGCDLFYTKDNTVTNKKKNQWLDVRMSSGFERAVLTTAFKTILAKYYNIDLFIGDEIDKASNDDDSIKLFSVLLGLNQFSQVFLISHKKALGNYLEENFSDDITLYEAKDGKFTKRN